MGREHEKLNLNEVDFMTRLQLILTQSDLFAKAWTEIINFRVTLTKKLDIFTWFSLGRNGATNTFKALRAVLSVANLPHRAKDKWEKWNALFVEPLASKFSRFIRHLFKSHFGKMRFRSYSSTPFELQKNCVLILLFYGLLTVNVYSFQFIS